MTREYCVRFAFRISPPLNVEEPQLEFEFAGRAARVRSYNSQAALRDSPQVVLNIPGFDEEGHAWQFARRLQAVAPLAAVRVGVGMDVGDNRATLQFSEDVHRAFKEAGGIDLRTTVRGIDVYEVGTVEFVELQATVSIAAQPSTLFDELERAFSRGSSALSEKAQLALRVRAEANLAADPIASFVLAIASVEALTAQGKWTPAQREIIEKLAAEIRRASLPIDQKGELERRLQTLQQVGVLEGMRRVLGRLGLEGLWPAWSEIYTVRSRVFHGDARPSVMTERLGEAMALSKQIVLAAAEAEAAVGLPS